jgi:hypothetical protein
MEQPPLDYHLLEEAVDQLFEASDKAAHLVMSRMVEWQRAAQEAEVRGLPEA